MLFQLKTRYKTHFKGPLIKSDTFNWKTQGSSPGHAFDTKVPTPLNHESVGNNKNTFILVFIFYIYILYWYVYNIIVLF